MPDPDDPPVREFADRGTKWLLDLPANLRGLLRLVEANLADRIDFDRAERINRSFIPEDLSRREADIVYRAPYRHGRGWVWIYVLLEHQSRPDRTMAFRLLCYMVQLWQMQMQEFEREKLPSAHRLLSLVVPVVLYTGKRKWAQPISLASLMQGASELGAFIPTWETLFVDLQRTPSDRLLDPGEAVLLALRALQAADLSKEALAEALKEAAARLDALPQETGEALSKALVYLYLLVRHKRVMEEQDDLFSVLDQAVEQHIHEREEAKMTGAEVLIRQGREEGRRMGREEGREEGRNVGKRDLLVDMIRMKFVSVPATLEARIMSLSGEEIDRVSRLILTAQTLADLEL